MYLKRGPGWRGTLMNHWLARYGLAAVLFGATLGLSSLLSSYGIKLSFTIPIVLSLVASAWYGGIGPGILISVLFHGTTILYVPLPAGTTMPQAIFGWVSVFLLYLFLVFLISGLRRIQADLAEQRDTLRTTLASIGDAVITTDKDGRITFMNGVAKRLTGWYDESEYLGRPLREVFAVRNEESGAAVADPVATVLKTGAVVGLADHTVLVSRGGNELPIADSAAPITDGSQIKGVVLVFSDMTQRRLAEKARRESEMMRRVVAAQEGERHRIARSLHDQLGQQMTALRLKIENVAGNSHDDAERKRSLEEMRHTAVRLDRDLGFLSWELKPTELGSLGLENALRTFVREWSQQYEIEAEFHIEPEKGWPRLPESVETNVFRIAQEGLNNVLRHSGAMRVTLLLMLREGHLVLIIEDDGDGFDSDRPPGLGLTGMQERAAMINGTLEIDSHPGEGTSVIVRAPVGEQLNGYSVGSARSVTP